MDDILTGFGALKISALSKARLINQYVDRVTIGPNSKPPSEPTQTRSFIRGDVGKKSPTPARVSPGKSIKNQGSPYKLIMEEVENERRNQVQNAIEARRKSILEACKQQENKHRDDWCKLQEEKAAKMRRQEMDILVALQAHDMDSKKKQEKLVKYYQELAARRENNDRVIREKEEKHKRFTKNVDSIYKAQKDFKTVYLEIIQELKECSDDVKEGLKEGIQVLKRISTEIEELVGKCKAGSVADADAVKGLDLIDKARKFKEDIGVKNVQHKEKVEKMKALEAAQKAEAQKKVKETSEVLKKQSDLDFVKGISLKRYSELQLFLQKHQEGFKDLVNSSELKTFKFNCKKAINIPVNALSAVRADHLMDKYNKLRSLLAGDVVKVADTEIRASQHPQGIAFCMDLLATKFILQGDLMISSNPEATFGYSAIIVALWNDFPDFGKILLAQFYKECPYLVPIYPPKTTDQTDEQFYLSLGYKYKDGAVEKQDKYLKRMSGILRLYFSIMITKPKHGQNKHPFDLSNAWKWLSDILNLEPRMDITATALFVFLDVLGSTMQKMYGKQFRKIIDFIYNVYLGLLKKNDSGGPAVRLELIFEEYRKSGMFKDPDGMLPAHFW